MIPSLREPIETLIKETAAWDIYAKSADVQHFVADLKSRLAALLSRVGTQDERIEAPQEGLTHPAHQVFFRAGLIACREYMARFVEAESPSIAASIRANWWPALGHDFGPPRKLEFKEVTVGEFDTPSFRSRKADEISPTQEALPIALAFLQQPTVSLSRVAASSPAEWQPIETAPKDGTKFWAVNVHDSQFVCRFNVGGNDPRCWHNLSANRWDTPTHWMPLPVSPDPHRSIP